MRRFLHRYILPSHHNNHRAKLLHHSTLFVLTFLFLFSGLFAYTLNKTNPEVLGISYSINRDELLFLTNSARQSQGLPPLQMSDTLNVAASAKASHMISNNYWAHFAPDGTSPWYFIKNAGYSYTFAGENLAKGFTTSGDVVNAWMNSPSHRDNIVSNKFSEIGFAVVEGHLTGEDTVLVVQMFGAQTAPAVAQAPQAQAAPPTVAPTRIPTFAPTATPLPTIQPEDENEIAGQEVEQAPVRQTEQALEYQPTISWNTLSKDIALGVLGLVILVLAIDVVVTERKKVPRLVGHNLDHIILLLLFALYLILNNIGGIL